MAVFRTPGGGSQVFCCCLPCAMVMAIGVAVVLGLLAVALWAR